MLESCAKSEIEQKGEFTWEKSVSKNPNQGENRNAGENPLKVTETDQIQQGCHYNVD